MEEDGAEEGVDVAEGEDRRGVEEGGVEEGAEEVVAEEEEDAVRVDRASRRGSRGRSFVFFLSRTVTRSCCIHTGVTFALPSDAYDEDYRERQERQEEWQRKVRSTAPEQKSTTSTMGVLARCDGSMQEEGQRIWRPSLHYVDLFRRLVTALSCFPLVLYHHPCTRVSRSYSVRNRTSTERGEERRGEVRTTINSDSTKNDTVDGTKTPETLPQPPKTPC